MKRILTMMLAYACLSIITSNSFPAHAQTADVSASNMYVDAQQAGLIGYDVLMLSRNTVERMNFSIEAYRIMDDATVAVLVNDSRQIMVCSLVSGNMLYSIQLPVPANDFEYHDGRFYVIADGKYMVFDESGNALETMDYPRPNRESFIITDIRRVDNMMVLHDANAITWLVTPDGIEEMDDYYHLLPNGYRVHSQYLNEKGAVVYYQTPDGRNGSADISLDVIGLEGKLACLSLISIDDGQLALELQTTHNTTESFVKSHFVVIDHQGGLINKVEVPINFLSYIPNPFRTAGDVWYYAFSGDEGVYFYRIDRNTNRLTSPNPERQLDWPEMRDESQNPSPENMGSKSATDWRTITQAWYNGNKYITKVWTPISSNLATTCYNVVSNLYIKTHVSNTSSQTGVPYKWCGFTRWYQFDDLASSGKKTGNKHCSVDDSECNGLSVYVSESDAYVVGVDCSGYVSRCWELPTRHTTSAIPNVCTDLGSVVSNYSSPSSFRKADALNRSAYNTHVMMYVGHNSENKIMVFESCGGYWKTVERVHPSSDFNSYYIMRYNNMKNVILRVSSMTLSQNGSTVTNVTQGQPLTVTYTVQNAGTESWTGNVSLWIEPNGGTITDIHDNNNVTIAPGTSQTFVFNNTNGVSSPVGTTKLYVKLKNVNASDYGRNYDAGSLSNANPKVFQIVAGSGGGGGGSTTCNSCPNYDDAVSLTTNVWNYDTETLGTNGCHIYRFNLGMNFFHTFQTCENGSADFDTKLYLYDQNCNLVASNDDYNGSAQSCIANYQSTYYGYHYLKVVGYNGASGTYTLASRRVPVTSPTVTTTQPSNIGSTTATCGGNVTDAGGTAIVAKGVCWSTSQYPTVSDSHTDEGAGTGTFTSQITGLTPNTTYYVRAYASNTPSTSYGTQYTFTTTSGGGGGSTTCNSCPTYDDAVSLTTNVWYYDTETLGTNGCHIYRFNLGMNFFHTFQTCENGTADFDTKLYLYDQNCTLVASNDDYNGSLQSCIADYQSTYNGYHYLKVVGYSGESGTYTLASRRVPVTSPTVTTSQPTNIGSTTATCGGNVTDAGGTALVAKGVCWSTSQYPTVSGSHTDEGAGTGTFTSQITGLTPNTTYYVRAYASNTPCTSYGTQYTFTTTCNVNVTISGNTTINPGQSTTLTASGANSYQWNTGATGASITVSPTTTTTYTVTGTASNGCSGTASVTVTVNSQVPTVTTSNVTSVGSTTATCGGNVTSNGGAAVTAKGVCWSTSPLPSISDSHTNDGSGNGSFTSQITGLTPNTNYYVRAYATNSAGTGYGTVCIFTTTCGDFNVTISGNDTIYTGQSTTLTASGANSYQWNTGATGASITVSPTTTTTYTVTGTNSYGCSTTASVTVVVLSPVPTVTTNTVTNIGSTMAACGGNVIASGVSAVTAKGVCWSISPMPSISDGHTNDGSGTGTFTSQITSLAPSTTYYVRAYATNSAGTGYGQIRTFTTACGSVNVIISGNTTIYLGQSTTLTASGASSYQWNTGATSASITVSPTSTTTYTVTGTTSNGCSGTSSVTVTVNSQVPTITTNTVTNIGSNTATCGGNVTFNGGSAVTAKGVCWSTSPVPSISDSHTNDGSGNTAFTSQMTGLTPNTTYYVRAYATNSVGTGYGQILSFTTSCAGMNVTITGTSEICQGETAVLYAHGADNYTWNIGYQGDNIVVSPTTTTTYSVTGTNTDGCTGTASFMVTVHPTYQTYETRTICDNELPYYWGGYVFNESGTQTMTLQSSMGCDSAAVMSLIVHYRSESHVNMTLTGDDLPFMYNGEEITEAGDYQFVQTGSEVCDSTVHLHITINQTGIYGTDNQDGYLSLAVHPNPTSGLLTITWNNGKEECPDVAKIEVYNTIGVKVMENYNSSTIDLSELSVGNYILHIILSDGTAIRKVMKR